MKGEKMYPKSFAGAATAAAVSALLAYAPAALAQQGGGQFGSEPGQRANYSSAPAEVQQVRGQIQDIRLVPIRGVDARNVLVLLKTQQGDNLVVDLGDRLRGLSLNAGDELAARGEVADLGNRRPILMANSFRYQGKTYDANRVAYYSGNRNQIGSMVGGSGPNQGPQPYSGSHANWGSNPNSKWGGSNR
jgi:hypothetical protein